MTRKPARAENVGSLLRPLELRTTADKFVSSSDKSIELNELEDRLINKAVQRQIDSGLDVVTDGEYRRSMFLDSFWGAVEGFSTNQNPVKFRSDDGSTITWNVQQIENRLSLVDSPAVREVTYLKTITNYPFKVTFPAPSLFALPFTFKPGINDHAYSNLEELVSHCVEIERSLVADAINTGARYIQFDFPAYPYLCDPDWEQAIIETGWTIDKVLDLAIQADKNILSEFRKDITVGMHVCRGNNQSRYLCEGPLDRVAERLFGDLDYDVIHVEWEDPARMGDFDSLRHVPKGGPIIALGVISSKRPELESAEEIIRRIDNASKYLDIDQLAVATQCGFGSTWAGNELSEDDQWRKLDLVGEVAARVWDSH
tara:strand:- start:453 stop:1565 length:1113 start_codon:yes stop_codon:yes gene_type:complete